MDAAREVMTMLLDHARMAGYLEGVVPQSSVTTDDHYGYVKTFDLWHELGLPYEGRIVCKFDAERTKGGLSQYGYEVKVDEAQDVPVPWDCGHGYVVLPRRFPVTRENPWDETVSSTFPKADAEAVLDVIRSIFGVKSVYASLGDDGWTVLVTLEDPWPQTSGAGATLLEAAESARAATVAQRTEAKNEIE